MMYSVFDTFNKTTISRHRTLDAAARADKAHQRIIKRANGPTSYIPTVVLKDGKALPESEYEVLCCLLAGM